MAFFSSFDEHVVTGVCLCVQASLNKLMETLDQSEPYFVKCIRSNAEKVNPATGIWLLFISDDDPCFMLFCLLSPLSAAVAFQ